MLVLLDHAGVAWPCWYVAGCSKPSGSMAACLPEGRLIEEGLVGGEVEYWSSWKPPVYQVYQWKQGKKQRKGGKGMKPTTILMPSMGPPSECCSGVAILVSLCWCCLAMLVCC